MIPLAGSIKTVTSLFRTQPKQVGLPPGSLIHVGDREMDRPVISRTDFDPAGYRHRPDVTLTDCRGPASGGGVCWLHLDGLHEVHLISDLGSLVGLHPLAQEDILNTHHPPKVEEYPEAILIIIKLLEIDSGTLDIRDEQLSMVLAPGRLLTFREHPGSLFNLIHQRLEHRNGKFRERGADYLAYALMDLVVDNYYHVLETIGEQLERIEAELIEQPSRDLLHRIHQLRGRLSYIRKIVSPLRDLTGSLVHMESDLIDPKSRLYLRDLHDHVLHVLDNLDNYRDTAKGLIELSLSNMSHRTNEIMQVLTVIASIFIPLTFIAGVYGMNFTLMPELSWRYGYPLVLLFMTGCAMAMLWYFRRKKWF